MRLKYHRQFCFFLFTVAISLAGFELSGQNVIGYSQSEVEKYFKENYPGLVRDDSFKNDHFNYLKYTDSQSKLITVLVFLTPKGKCRMVRLIYDPSLEKKVRENLNSDYENAGQDKWIDNNGRHKAIVSLSKEDWFITVSFYPEKN